jgi:hypothetical protein
MFILPHTIKRLLSQMLVVAFATVSVFGVLVCAGMVAPNEPATSGVMIEHCAHSTDPMCLMSIEEHIDMWTAAFGATLVSGMVLAFALIVAALAMQVFGTRSLPPHRARDARHYIREHPNLLVYNKFVQLFARGLIVHQTYA